MTTQQKLVGEAPPRSLAEEKPETRKSTKRIVTLEELGPHLPFGVSIGGGPPKKEFSVRPMKTADNRTLAKKKKKQNMGMAEYVGLILGNQMGNIGGYDFASMKDGERTLRLGQLYMGDVLYAYVYLRRESMGDDLKMEVRCGVCPNKAPFTWVGKLGTVEISVADDEKDLGWTYELRRPIHLRSEKVTKVRCMPPRWSTALETPPGNSDLAVLALVRGGIVGINDGPDTSLADHEIDELSLPDLEYLTKEFDDHYLGPKMAIEGACPNCETEFSRPIDWRHESFFGASSV